MAKAIVIGAGFGGMAAALRLRAKGYDVTIIDKQDKLGGRAYQYERKTQHGTFIHDAGPTVITAKFLFDELFELFGKKREDYVEFRDIYPWYRIVFAGEVTHGTGETPVPRTNPVGWGSSPPSTYPPTRGGDEPHPTKIARKTTSTVGARHGSPANVDQPTTGDACVAPTKMAIDFPFFDYGGSLEQFEAQIAKFEPKDVEGFRKFLVHSKKIFDVGFIKLGDQPFDKFTTMLRCAPALIRLQNYKTVYGMAKKYIKNESLRRVFSFQPLLVGGNPFNTTSIYSLIFYLERQWGVQFAMGGTGAIVRGLERLMREEGIEIRLGEEVEKIDITFAQYGWGNRKVLPTRGTRQKMVKLSDHVVDGVTLKGGLNERASVVIVNGDAPHVYEHLIKDEYHQGLAARRLNRKSKIGNLKFSMGLFVLYFGTTKQYPNVAHHTIVLGHAYKELITKLFDTHELETDDLSVYLHRPTATDPGMAPPGCDSFYCLIPVPNLQPPPNRTSGGRQKSAPATDVPYLESGAIDWARYGDTFKGHVIDYLQRTVLPGLSECIVDDFYVTPEHFAKNLNTLHGTGFSIQPIFSQSAYFRFHNKAPGIEGLYFVGAGTHPGAGMPGVLCSAKVVDRLVPAVTPPVPSPGNPGEG